MDLVSKEVKDRFQLNLRSVQELISYRFQHPLNLVNLVWMLNPVKTKMDKCLWELADDANKVISEVRKQFDSNTNINVDMAGKSPVELMVKAGFSDAEIFAEMATFYSAGHETASSSLILLLFLLSKYTDHQEKCREEIDTMFRQMITSNSNEISMEAVNSLTFLDKCIKESLRLYPVIPVFARDLKSPIQLNANTYLPSNTFLITSPWIMHRNPRIFPEPEKFDPYRFLPEMTKQRAMCDYMPFSAGLRNCIGFKSAMIELKLLADIFYTILKCSSEISIDELTQALRKKVWHFPDLNIQVHPRQ